MLTAKQQVFVDEYLVDMNATQAAIRAGYSPRSRRGAKLMKIEEVRRAVEERMMARQARTEITQDMVLRELAAIGFADIADYVQVVRDEEGKARVDITQTQALDAYKRAAIASIKCGYHGVEIKLNDKLRALEILGKHLGIFRENKGEDVTDEELVRQMEDMMKLLEAPEKDRSIVE